MVLPSEYVDLYGMKCVSINTIKAKHSAEEFDKFDQWYTGQTGVVGPDSELFVYSHDYERWIHEGKKTEQDPETWD